MMGRVRAPSDCGRARAPPRHNGARRRHRGAKHAAPSGKHRLPRAIRPPLWEPGRGDLRPGPREPGPSSTLVRRLTLSTFLTQVASFRAHVFDAHCVLSKSLTPSGPNRTIALAASREENSRWGAAHSSRRGRDPRKAAKPKCCESFSGGGRTYHRSGFLMNERSSRVESATAFSRRSELAGLGRQWIASPTSTQCPRRGSCAPGGPGRRRSH
jgi:hypothetical protein